MCYFCNLPINYCKSNSDKRNSQRFNNRDFSFYNKFVSYQKQGMHEDSYACLF